MDNTIKQHNFVVVFNDGHVLHLRSETFAVRRRMIYGLQDTVHDGHMIAGDECGLNFLTFVVRLGENPGKKPLPGIRPDKRSNPGALREK